MKVKTVHPRMVSVEYYAGWCTQRGPGAAADNGQGDHNRLAIIGSMVRDVVTKIHPDVHSHAAATTEEPRSLSWEC